MITLQQTKHALGSEAVLTIVVPNRASGEQLLARLWKAVDEFEARFSRFKADSELTLFNQNAGSAVSISAPFRRLLERAKELSERTTGLYNPFILPALQQAGYVGSWPNPKTVDKNLDYRERNVHDITALHIEDDFVHIPADAAIDFGGIGKGYLLDQLALAAEGKVHGYWFSLGGDIICSGYDESGKPWRLHVQAAEEPAKAVAFVENKGGMRLSLATSGITKRGGKKGERSWHHLIDPRTGLSSTTDILTVSVARSNATEADVFASCVVLLGSSEGLEFLKARNTDGLLQLNFTTPYSQSLRSRGDAFKLEAKEPAA